MEKKRFPFSDETGCLQQDEVLKEAKACLTDTDRRLEKAFEDLEDTVNEAGETLGETEDLAEAKTLLEGRP